MSYAYIKGKVVGRIGLDVYEDILQFVTDCRPRLWGELKPRGFLAHNVCLALYKDLFAQSYNDLAELDLGFHLSLQSLSHNVQTIRPLLKEWSQGHIEPGKLPDWTAAVRGVQMDPKFPVSSSDSERFVVWLLVCFYVSECL